MSQKQNGSRAYPMVSVGFKNVVARNRIVAVISPNSRPVRLMMNDARQRGKLIDATLGKKTKAVIIMDSDHIVLSANTVDTIAQRIQESNEVVESEE